MELYGESDLNFSQTCCSLKYSPYHSAQVSFINFHKYQLLLSRLDQIFYIHSPLEGQVVDFTTINLDAINPLEVDLPFLAVLGEHYSGIGDYHSLDKVSSLFNQIVGIEGDIFIRSLWEKTVSNSVRTALSVHYNYDDLLEFRLRGPDLKERYVYLHNSINQKMSLLKEIDTKLHNRKMLYFQEHKGLNSLHLTAQNYKYFHSVQDHHNVQLAIILHRQHISNVFDPLNNSIFLRIKSQLDYEVFIKKTFETHPATSLLVKNLTDSD